MKSLKLFLVLLCSFTFGFAQQGVNYKAIVKDGSGNVVANTLIVVQFNILKGVAQTNEYQEQFTPTTNENGLIILTIGEGTALSGVFEDVDWGSDNHFLNTYINTGGGLVDMGTTEFMAVPYAKHAEIAANVTGLEKITENGNLGWRLKGHSLLNYHDIGVDAVDLSISSVASSPSGASGDYSVAMGNDTEATGDYSIAMGKDSQATGDYSTAIGKTSLATGDYSTTLGREAWASGNISTAIGFQSNAPSYAEVAIGMNNTTYTPNSTNGWDASDRIFVIGNGVGNAFPNDALTVLKNGTITAPSFDLGEIVDDKALVTKEYFDTNNISSSGLEALNEGNGIGWRLKGRNPSNYGNIGADAVDLSFSEAYLATVGATGSFSTAMGFATTASGTYSTAMGFVTNATSGYSTAMGYYTTASGLYSTAMGYYTAASGQNSTANGFYTDADSYASFVIGRYNIGGGNADSWNANDPLFEIGNGSNDASRSNALTVLKSGKHIINSSDDGLLINNAGGNGIFIDSPSDNGLLINFAETNGIYINEPEDNGIRIGYPQGNGISIGNSFRNGIEIINTGDDGIFIEYPGDEGVFVNSPGNNGIKVINAGDNGGVFTGTISGVRATSSNNINPDIILGGTANTSSGDDGIIASDPNYAGSDIFLRSNDAVVIQLDYDDNEGGHFQVKNSSDAVVFEIDETGNIKQNGSTIHASDRRLKKDIENLNYGLDEVLQLQPKAYNWKDRVQDHKSLGLIAQEVQKIIKEVVVAQDDKQKTLGISYTELIPVLIKAIQEQQEVIRKQQSTVNSLQTSVSSQKDDYTALLERIVTLEKSNPLLVKNK